jgi:hypothetical protein
MGSFFDTGENALYEQFSLYKKETAFFIVSTE